MKNILFGLLVLGIVGILLVSAWFVSDKSEQVEQCTYAVLVSDFEENRVLSDVKVTYVYNQQQFVGYSDSEGYYRTTIQCDKDASPLVIIKIEKQGYKAYNRYISKNLQHVEQMKLSVDKLADLKLRAVDDIKASNELGHIYKAGEGDEPMNYELAHEYFSLGAEKGDKEAQTQLGIMFEKGQFVKCDYEQAIDWYQKAANQGYPEAQSHLGRMFYEGKGVIKNETKGIKLLILASQNGFMQAKHFIDEINRSKQKPILIPEEQQVTKTVYKPEKSDKKPSTEFSCNNVTEIPQAECEELVHFYQTTGGDNWTDNEGWLQTHQPCDWYGIRCENGSVVKLVLGNLFIDNNLTGNIPDFNALTQLKELFLSNNKLSGAIPDFNALTQLQTLSLSENRLSGAIPDLSALTQLQILYLSDNNLCQNPNINYERWREAKEYPTCE
ncbi:leucine-rich repeat domain-containing protein [Candidatus Albibeggiatoa sp. nov. BB20]|uniref:leucine-rich repeat domain-containing protein n=1 Tax=Candidatus Albibeggiatoa sp. nov. BB20 TaxID=3162723 RepID=UPI003365A0D6